MEDPRGRKDAPSREDSPCRRSNPDDNSSPPCFFLMAIFPLSIAIRSLTFLSFSPSYPPVVNIPLEGGQLSRVSLGDHPVSDPSFR